jgi:hypothetical protein
MRFRYATGTPMGVSSAARCCENRKRDLRERVMKKLFAAVILGMFAMTAVSGAIAADKKDDKKVEKKKDEKKK